MHADSKLQEYYTRRSEADRLATREGYLEHVRSKELIARYLPEPPVRIIDIGGGTGTYASWLASLGYDVHMVDVVGGHVEVAASVGSFTAAVGDARALEASDHSYDAALVLGPLYHLPRRDDRLLALREAVRVVKPGGVVMAAFISRLAIPLDAYVKGWIDMERGLAGLSNAVQIGHDAEGGFGAIAYFHLPSEISPELLSVGLEVQQVLGVEGPGWIAPDFEARWADAAARETILDCARQCEALPEILGLSPHIIAIARNP